MKSTPKVSTEYLEELRIQLRSQGFTVHCNESRDIDVEHDGSTLCRINDCGNLGYFAEKIAGKELILDRIREMARSTREYMTLIEQAPPLEAEGLGEGYKLLAEFNGTVLAGHMTEYGAQFITWDWAHNRTSLWQGHYYGVGGDGRGYRAAKGVTQPAIVRPREDGGYEIVSGHRRQKASDGDINSPEPSPFPGEGAEGLGEPCFTLFYKRNGGNQK